MPNSDTVVETCEIENAIIRTGVAPEFLIWAEAQDVGFQRPPTIEWNELWDKTYGEGRTTADVSMRRRDTERFYRFFNIIQEFQTTTAGARPIDDFRAIVQLYHELDDFLHNWEGEAESAAPRETAMVVQLTKRED